MKFLILGIVDQPEDRHDFCARKKRNKDRAGTWVKAILDLGAKAPNYVGLEPSQGFQGMTQATLFNL